MIRRLWGLILQPWRHDRAFAQRMWRATFDAQAQSRISLDAQERLRQPPDRDRPRPGGALDLDDANEALFGRPRPSRQGRDT